MLKNAVAALALLYPTVPAVSQIVGKPIVANGSCEPRSGVTIDKDPSSRFACDFAIVTQSETGTILVQFADKTGRDGRILGFAGEFEGRQGLRADPLQAVIVERLYLKGGGEPLPVGRGTCFLTWQRRTLVMIVCGARTIYRGQDIQAIVALKAQ